MHKLNALTVLTGLTAALVGAVLPGCAATEKGMVEQGLKPLSGQELQALFSRDRTLSWVNQQNRSGTATYTPDGRTELSWGTGSATGHYRIVGNTACSQFPGSAVRGGAESCSRWYKTGDNTFALFRENGEAVSTVSFTH